MFLRKGNILQIFDEEFSDWLDVDDTLAVPDKGKLKITLCCKGIRSSL
jgi:hypothetical protein